MRLPSAVPEDGGNQLVVAEGAGAGPPQLLARPVLRFDGLHAALPYAPTARGRPFIVLRRILLLMSRVPARVAPLSSFCLFLLLAVTAGCAEPPRKEMDQAQGAIDAARAAGADDYASAEVSAAAAALARAEEAVAQRDYRQALSQALDARERAQTAARDAADRKAEARGAAERDVQALASTVERAVALPPPPAARGAAATAQAAAFDTAVADAQRALQEARAALDAQRFIEASTLVRGPAERLQAEMSGREQAATTAPPARPTRRPR